MSAPDKTFIHQTPAGEVRIEFWDKGHKYAVNGEKSGFTSVSAVSGQFEKGGLYSWHQDVGVVGAAKSAAQGVDLSEWIGGNLDITIDEWKDQGLREKAMAALKERGLRSWDIQDRAKDRGNEVHLALEVYGKTGKVPTLSDFEPEVRPYIQGLAKFLSDADPQIVGSEVMVASLAHKFVGTYDLRAAFKSCSLVENAETGARFDLPLGMGLCDAKTGKVTYDEASDQLAGYELASIECGMKPTDYRLVIRLTGQGGYEVTKCWTTAEQFARLVDAWHARQEIKKSKAEQSAERAVAA